ncbi:MAG: HNH endonuclease [Sedimentisphaerales bacterium]|jgi:hypothetical protein
MAMEINIKLRIPTWVERILIQPALFYRRVRYGYTFRRIPLTQRQYAIVDCDDYERLTKWKWYALKSRRTYYAARNEWQRTAVKKRKCKMIMMHNEVLRPAEGMLADHRNDNGLDNRKANLREATQEENARNRRKARTKSGSIYKGVWYLKRDGRWAARIRVDGCAKHIGVYDDEAAAAKAYDRAAREYYKEFARLNFPD